MLFCDKMGQMVHQRTVDLNTLGKNMNDNQIPVAQAVCDNMSSLLEAFGGITYTDKTVTVLEKQEEKKHVPKKEVEPKYIEVQQKLVNYSDFEKAIRRIAEFDVELYRLGKIKNPKLENEWNALKEK